MVGGGVDAGAGPEDCCVVVEGVPVDEVVVVAWFVVDGGGTEVESVLMVGGDGGVEEEETVSLEFCSAGVSIPVPNVNNGVWYSWLLCSTE